MKWLLIVAAAFAAVASAADIGGTWKGTAEMQGNAIERTFVFKVDGSKLTGETTSQMMGTSAITDGRIDGDNISFTVAVKFQDNEMKLNYKGKVSGDTIKLTVDFSGFGGGGGQTIEWTLKKVS
jgi:hypothetical protein